MSKHTHHLIIALLAGIIVGILIARWLDAHTEPQPRDPKPPKGRYYAPDAGTPPGKVLIVDADERKASGQ